MWGSLPPPAQGGSADLRCRWGMIHPMDNQTVKVIAIILILCLVGMVFIGFL